MGAHHTTLRAYAAASIFDKSLSRSSFSPRSLISIARVSASSCCVTTDLLAPPPARPPRILNTDDVETQETLGDALRLEGG